ncbi:MAG: hypothetical protein OJF55_002854 [Rhodanobacteraceae bacterium]|jgi:hypothetical protein|nr:MAG: hypothetical protein OJF55_002854 [Rhodanobacteraceae bacterium]
MAIQSVTNPLPVELRSAAEEMEIWADRMRQVGAILACAKKGPRADELIRAAHYLTDDGAESLTACASSLRLKAEQIAPTTAHT